MEGSDDRVISVIPLATKDKLTPTYVPIRQSFPFATECGQLTACSSWHLPLTTRRFIYGRLWQGRTSNIGPESVVLKSGTRGTRADLQVL